jgi:pSer/pThr/pTyr-binding forkhead associated (FHA) protein
MSLSIPLAGRVAVDTPFLRVEDSGEVISLRGEVTTVGRGRGVDIRLDDPSVSRLHAELVRRGPYVYVVDLGLSRNGTRVNGRPIARRVLRAC